MRLMTAAAGAAIASMLLPACSGASTPTGSQSSPPPAAAATEVTVQLSPSSGPAGTKIVVTVPQCEAGLKAGLAPISRILMAPQDPVTDDGFVLSGEVARGTFSSDGSGSISVPGGTAAGTYYVGVQCPVNLGSATTGGFQLPDGTTADQGFGSAAFDVR